MAWNCSYVILEKADRAVRVRLGMAGRAVKSLAGTAAKFNLSYIYGCCNFKG